MVPYDRRAQKERGVQSKLVFFPSEGGELDKEFFLRVKTCEEVKMGQGRGVGCGVEGKDVSRCWAVGRRRGLKDDEFAYFEEGFA